MQISHQTRISLHITSNTQSPPPLQNPTTNPILPPPAHPSPHPKPSHPLTSKHYQSSLPPCLPCIAACLCLNASASPPAILPPLSLAPPLSTPLPLYPLSLAESGAGAGFLLVGGAGAGAFARPFAGRAGGGGGGGGAERTSSRYAEGAQPVALLSRREASHQPVMYPLVSTAS